MVKRIRRPKNRGVDPAVLAQYKAIEQAMLDPAADFSDIFNLFFDMNQDGNLGVPTRDTFITSLLRKVGEEGIGSVQLSGTPQVMAYRLKAPPLFHGAAMFENAMVPFFYLPSISKGLAACSGPDGMHYVRLTATLLSPDSNPVPGNDTRH